MGTQYKPPKTCILCKYIDFDAGASGYTLYPGADWSAECSKEVWDMYGCDVTHNEFRDTLLTAQNCEHFTPAETQEDQGK